MTTTIPYDTISVTSRSEAVSRRCCFCVPLRTGCFILGYFNLIFNAFHTISILVFTTVFGITTQGFEHLDFESSKFDDDLPNPPHIVEKSLLNHIQLFLLVGLCANFVWLLVNVACLIGLHKKRPGPIKLYVGFVTARLVFSFFGLLYLTMNAPPSYSHTFITNSVDLGLTSYFILVYYIYAMQLEKELIETVTTRGNSLPAIEKGTLPASDEKVTDIAFIYPIDADKTNLVAQ